MKIQAKTQIVLAVVVLFFALLVAGMVVAQRAPTPPSNTWTSGSRYGITVTIGAGHPATIPGDFRVFKYSGEGKNGSPKGTGKSGNHRVPELCAPVNGRPYSEEYPITLNDGTEITLKLEFNKDCSIRTMKVIDSKKQSYELYRTSRYR